MLKPDEAPQDRRDLSSPNPFGLPAGGRMPPRPNIQRSMQSRPTGSSGHIVVMVMDIVRRTMMIAGLAAAVIFAFLIYHLVAGIVPHWSESPAEIRDHAVGVLNGATSALNFTFVVFLITVCVFNWSEEVLGAVLAIAGLVVYFGVPYLIGFLAQGQIESWQAQHNLAALAIFDEVQTLGLLAAIPGVPLFIRTLFLQSRNTFLEKHEELGTMRFGGTTEKQVPVPGAIVGAAAACWQMPYCKPLIREGCPIYLTKSRCWRARVGCMCEDNITNIIEPLLRKSEISTEVRWSGEELNAEQNTDDEIHEVAPWEREVLSNKQQAALRTDAKTGRVQIPYNTVLSNSAKRERCRNCVIYNEHQRQKYRLLAPAAVLCVPIVAFLYFETLATWLQQSVFGRLDAAMASLALDQSVQQTGLGLASIPPSALYVLAGCGLAIALAMVLRLIEYCVFVLKI